MNCDVIILFQLFFLLLLLLSLLLLSRIREHSGTYSHFLCQTDPFSFVSHVFFTTTHFLFTVWRGRVTKKRHSEPEASQCYEQPVMYVGNPEPGNWRVRQRLSRAPCCNRKIPHEILLWIISS